MPAAVARKVAAYTNLLALTGLYLSLFIRNDHPSPFALAARAAGWLPIAVVAYFSLTRNRHRRVAAGGLGGVFARAALSLAPWLALVGVAVVRGPWWTQRPYLLRLLATYLVANWSFFWCSAEFAVGQGTTDEPSARADARIPAAGVGSTSVAVMCLAGALGLVGLEGLAFGVTTFGVIVSALAALAAATALVVATLGGPPAQLKLLAAAAATLFALGSVEVGLRLLHMGEALQETDSLEYAREFYTLTPPRSAYVNRPKPLDEFPPALIETNSLGIRGPEVSAPVDLLLIGDSFVEARQLPWEQTLAPQLRRALHARGVGAVVVGHGMRGWSPLLEWNWYLKVGRGLRPRTVVLFFFWNDLWPKGAEATTFRAVMGPDGRPDHFESVVESDWLWYKHSRAVRLAADVLQRFGLQALKQAFAGAAARRAGGAALDTSKAAQTARQMAAGAMLSDRDRDALLTRPESSLDARLRSVAWSAFWPGLRPLSLWTEEQREAAGITEGELQRFADDVAANGGRLAILYVPNPYQIAPSECSVGRYFDGLDAAVVLPPDSGVQEWLRSVTARHGIDLLDPSSAMRDAHRAESNVPPFYLRADCHWSERGHQFIAGYVADWYLKSRH